MEGYGGPRFDCIGALARKKRTQISRRPRPDNAQPLSTNRDTSPFSSDEANGSKRKEFNLNQCASRALSEHAEKPSNKKIKVNGRFSSVNDNGRSEVSKRRSSEGVLAPANWKSSSKVKENLDSQSRSSNNSGRNGGSQGSGQSGVILDGLQNEKKVNKVKLKVGGVTRTIHANSSGSGSSTKVLQSKDNADDDMPPSYKGGLQGIRWKEFSVGGFSLSKEETSAGKSPVRKSKRVPKKRVLDGEYDEAEDDEIRYLEKLKTAKASAGYRDNGDEPTLKQHKISRVSKIRSGNVKKLRPDGVSEDTDYEEEEEAGSDCVGEAKTKKIPRKESVESLMESKREFALTKRQQALQSSKDGSSLIEFPNGLPPAVPRKQKEKLTEVEQQLKKTEAAQRRRLQVEKAARESEAEAIRKILGQDSSRKKREDKNKKRQEEMAQEKAANAHILPPNIVRWVSNPTGTFLTFSNETGMPSILDQKPRSYPPPREKCAGPSCTNTYKYRDSNSKLPLCSLECYKAVRAKLEV